MILITSCAVQLEDDKQVHDFVMGADISWLTEMEANGATFKDNLGRTCDCFELLKDYGLQAVRLRVFVDPSEHGNWCNLQDVLSKAKRAKQAGMDIMIAFHYSDWWADPSHQDIPALWSNHDYIQLKNDVRNHTFQVLTLLKENNISPSWVQIGNETSNGFLWPIGRATDNQLHYAGLFKVGADTAKQVFPDVKVIVHLDRGHDLDLYRWNLDILKKGGASWDVIGMSVYPFWAMQENHDLTAEMVIDASVNNMQILSDQYNCEVMVVETGMECSRNGKICDEEVLRESKILLEKLLVRVSQLPKSTCTGVFYWEPECKPSQYHLGAFTETGCPTIIMDAFRSF